MRLKSFVARPRALVPRRPRRLVLSASVAHPSFPEANGSRSPSSTTPTWPRSSGSSQSTTSSTSTGCGPRRRSGSSIRTTTRNPTNRGDSLQRSRVSRFHPRPAAKGLRDRAARRTRRQQHAAGHLRGLEEFKNVLGTLPDDAHQPLRRTRTICTGAATCFRSRRIDGSANGVSSRVLRARPASPFLGRPGEAAHSVRPAVYVS